MRTTRWPILLVLMVLCACRFSAIPSLSGSAPDESSPQPNATSETRTETLMPGLPKNTIPPQEYPEEPEIIVPTGNLPPIAFTAHGWCVQGSGEEIFLINPDGSGLLCITRMQGDDRDPAWSPDGTQIAFVSDRTGIWQIFVMDANGENQTQVTTAKHDAAYPTWNQNGDGIYYSLEETRGSSIHLIQVDGSHDQVLLQSQGELNSYPDLSPDGKWIAFSRFGGDIDAGIWVMGSDGSEPRLVASGALHYPDWSPDGTRIVLDGEPHGCKFDIYVINADGTDMRQITDHPDGCGAYNKKPVWSPDGLSILFASQLKTDSGQAFELFIADADGGNPHQITHLDGDRSLYSGSYHADWNPAAE